MFSQYNIEKQAEARQAEARRSAQPGTPPAPQRPPASDCRAALGVGVLAGLALAAPIVGLVLWLAVR